MNLKNISLLASIAPMLLAANERDGFRDANGAGLLPGDAYAANESDFDSAHYDQQLTGYLVGGWDQDPVEAMLDFFAPAIATSRSVDYKEYESADEFLMDDADDDIRALGADFKEIQRGTRTNRNIKVPNKGFKLVLDKDELAADPGKERRELRRVMRRLLRNDLRRAIALIDAAATSVNLVFDGSSDPDALLRGQLLLAEQTAGLRPNRIGIGSAAWDLRDKAHRAQNTAGSRASADWTPERLAQYLMVEMISFGEVRYRSAVDALAALVGSNAYMFNAAEGISEEDPSNIKRFTANAFNGQRLAVYKDDSHAKLVTLSVEHYSHVAITSTLGIRKAVIAAA